MRRKYGRRKNEKESLGWVDGGGIWNVGKRRGWGGKDLEGKGKRKGKMRSKKGSWGILVEGR